MAHPGLGEHLYGVHCGRRQSSDGVVQGGSIKLLSHLGDGLVLLHVTQGKAWNKEIRLQQASTTRISFNAPSKQEFKN